MLKHIPTVHHTRQARFQNRGRVATMSLNFKKHLPAS